MRYFSRHTNVPTRGEGVAALGILLCALSSTPELHHGTAAAADPDSRTTSPGDDADTLQRNTSRLLAQTQFEVAVSARDVEFDPVKASHYFLHAGLNAARASDQQLAIDAGHAAQDVAGAVEFSLPHNSKIGGAAVSPRGDLLCSWCDAGRAVRVWSLTTGRHVRSLTLPTRIGWAKFHPHRNALLISAHNSIVVWPFDRDQPDGQFNPFAGTGRVGSTWANFHPDSETVVVRGSRVIWRWSPGSDPKKYSDPFGTVLASRSAWDGEPTRTAELVTQIDGNRVRVWNLQKGKVVREIECDGPVLKAVLHPAGRQLMTWHGLKPGQSVAQFWSLDPSHQEPQHRLEKQSAPGKVRTSPDGRHLLAWGEWSRSNHFGHGTTAKSMTLWSWDEGQIVATLTHDKPVRDGAFDSTGSHLVTWSPDIGVTLWSWRKDQFERFVAWPIEDVDSVHFHPTRPQLLVVRGKKTSPLFDIPAFRKMSSTAPLRRFAGIINKAIFTSDGQRLVTWGDEPVVRIWNLDSPGSLLQKYEFTSSEIRRVHWLKDQRFAIGGHSEGRFGVWSSSSSKPLWQISGSHYAYGHYTLLSASPSGEHLIALTKPDQKSRYQFELRSIYRHEPLRQWDYAMGDHNRRIFQFVDDRRYLMSFENKLQLFELGRETPLRQWNASYYPGRNVPFPDGRHLFVATGVTRDDRNEVLLLSLEDDEPLRRIPGEADFVSARLLPDESGVLVWHQWNQTVNRRPHFARLHYLNAKRPAVTFKTFSVENLGSHSLDAIDFDRQCRFIVATNKFRQGWLWSTESGMLLKEFHRRDSHQTGVDQTGTEHARLDPLGRFVVTWGGGSLRIWSLADFRQIAQRDLDGSSNVIAVRNDGTFVTQTRHGLRLMSSSGHPAPLRSLDVSEYECDYHADKDRVLAICRGRGVFDRSLIEWNLTTWDMDDLASGLKQLERRTAQQLDPQTGRLRHLSFSEFNHESTPDD